MYLGRSARILCWIIFGLGVLLLVPLIAAMMQGHAPGKALVGVLIFGGLFLLPTGIPLALYYTSEASKVVAHRDVLREDLRLSGLHEVKGVQFLTLPVPDEAAPGAELLLSVFLQNAHSTPRRVRVFAVRGAVEPVGGATVWETLLEGGESGVLNVPCALRTDLTRGAHAIRHRLVVERPGTIGRRMLPEERQASGLRWSSALPDPIVIVAPGATSAQGAAAFAGFRRLFRPDAPAVADEALRFLAPPAAPSAGPD